METSKLFDGIRSKRLKTAFALYSMPEDDLPAEVQKWFVDYEDPSKPVVATWRESGIVSVEVATVQEYKESLYEYKRLINISRIDVLGWEENKEWACRRMNEAQSKSERRFWISFISALEFLQIDTRF